MTAHVKTKAGKGQPAMNETAGFRQLKLDLRMIAVVLLVAAFGSPASAQSLEKTLQNGWNSVVRDASKAAKAVSRAADEAVSPKKRRRKSSKAQPEEALPPPVPNPRKATARQSWEAATARETPLGKDVPDTAPYPVRPEREQAKTKNNWAPLPITMIPPKANPKRGTAGDGKDAPAEEETWSNSEVAEAKAQCETILKSIKAVTVPQPPLKEGPCGAPAPVRLISIGRKPTVIFSPAPVVTCAMVSALDQWLKDDLQPMARKHLGSPIIKVQTMSDYSCRMAYGRKGNKLSEHGRANALDIRGFVLANGKSTHVLDRWGKTKRDLKAEAAERAAKQAAAAKAEAAVENAVASAGETPSPTKASVSQDETESAEKVAAAAIVPEKPRSKTSQFMRDAHTRACQIFRTALGPEANEAHRNHFHVDMAKRRRNFKVCE